MPKSIDTDQHFGTSGLRAAHANVADSPAPAETAAEGNSTTTVRSTRLQSASEFCAGVFDAMLEERWKAGDDSASNRAIAERYVQVDEKQIRKWRSNDKRIPLAALLVLPPSISSELEKRLRQSRYGRMTTGELAAEMAEIGRQIAEREK